MSFHVVSHVVTVNRACDVVVINAEQAYCLDSLHHIDTALCHPFLHIFSSLSTLSQRISFSYSYNLAIMQNTAEDVSNQAAGHKANLSNPSIPSSAVHIRPASIH